jgi:hypothetical protein
MANETEIRELFAKHNVGLSRDDVWTVQGQYVIRHKALERLAVAIGMRWDMPQILRAERDEAVILVAGELPTGVREWSIGEALIGSNYRVSGKQAAYVFAMAEKRAKDRVIIKLAGLHGVYSEEEADEFRSSRASESEVSVETSTANRDALIKAMTFAESEQDLAEWGSAHNSEIQALLEADRQCVRSAYKDRLMSLRNQRAA